MIHIKNNNKTKCVDAVQEKFSKDLGSWKANLCFYLTNQAQKALPGGIISPHLPPCTVLGVLLTRFGEVWEMHGGSERGEERSPVVLLRHMLASASTTNKLNPCIMSIAFTLCIYIYFLKKIKIGSRKKIHISGINGQGKDKHLQCFLKAVL